MAKKKKTREQKILAEIHRRAQVTPQKQFSLVTKNSDALQNKKVASEKSQPSPTSHVATSTHANYLMHDLRKTVLLTSIIIVIQLILRAFLP